MIIQIEFLSGKHSNLESTDPTPKLQGVVEFEVYGHDFYFTTEAVKVSSSPHDDYGTKQKAWFDHRYYFNVEDDKKLQSETIEFDFELWWMWPVDDEGNHLGDKKLVNDDTSYTIGTAGTTKYRKFEDDMDGKWANDNKLEIEIKTFALDKCNTIAIFEVNSSFNGRYQEQEHMNIIQLYVTDNNASSPFDQGPNAIVIPTSLFTNTKLNSYLQKEQLEKTPLYTSSGKLTFFGRLDLFLSGIGLGLDFSEFNKETNIFTEGKEIFSFTSGLLSLFVGTCLLMPRKLDSGLPDVVPRLNENKAADLVVINLILGAIFITAGLTMDD